MSSRIEDVSDMDFPLPEPVTSGNTLGFFDQEAAQAHAQVQSQMSNLSLGSKRTADDYLVAEEAKINLQTKNWVCLYPIYFDTDVPRGKGRHVSKDFAVKEPHTRQLAEAVRRLNLNVIYQPQKSHPRSMFNPGRVKVQLRDDRGALINKDIPNRKVLMQRTGAELPFIFVEREPEAVAESLMDSDMDMASLLPSTSRSPSQIAPPPAKTASTANTATTASSKKAAKASKQKKGKGSKNLV